MISGCKELRNDLWLNVCYGDNVRPSSTLSQENAY